LSIHRRSRFPVFEQETDVQSVFDLINAFTEPITFTVAAPGAAVVVAHTLEYVPRMAIQVAAPGLTGTGSVYDGGVAWTSTTVSLTATAAGTYTVLLRR
jgi:autotransporter translocation and assembly factor TamB